MNWRRWFSGGQPADSWPRLSELLALVDRGDARGAAALQFEVFGADPGRATAPRVAVGGDLAAVRTAFAEPRPAEPAWWLEVARGWLQAGSPNVARLTLGVARERALANAEADPEELARIAQDELCLRDKLRHLAESAGIRSENRMPPLAPQRRARLRAAAFGSVFDRSRRPGGRGRLADSLRIPGELPDPDDSGGWWTWGWIREREHEVVVEFLLSRLVTRGLGSWLDDRASATDVLLHASEAFQALGDSATAYACCWLAARINGLDPEGPAAEPEADEPEVKSRIRERLGDFEHLGSRFHEVLSPRAWRAAGGSHIVRWAAGNQLPWLCLKLVEDDDWSGLAEVVRPGTLRRQLRQVARTYGWDLQWRSDRSELLERPGAATAERLVPAPPPGGSLVRRPLGTLAGPRYASVHQATPPRPPSPGEPADRGVGFELGVWSEPGRGGRAHLTFGRGQPAMLMMPGHSREQWAHAVGSGVSQILRKGAQVVWLRLSDDPYPDLEALAGPHWVRFAPAAEGARAQRRWAEHLADRRDAAEAARGLLLADLPPQLRAVVAPCLPNVLGGLYQLADPWGSVPAGAPVVRYCAGLLAQHGERIRSPEILRVTIHALRELLGRVHLLAQAITCGRRTPVHWDGERHALELAVVDLPSGNPVLAALTAVLAVSALTEDTEGDAGPPWNLRRVAPSGAPAPLVEPVERASLDFGTWAGLPGPASRADRACVVLSGEFGPAQQALLPWFVAGCSAAHLPLLLALPGWPAVEPAGGVLRHVRHLVVGELTPAQAARLEVATGYPVVEHRRLAAGGALLSLSWDGGVVDPRRLVPWPPDIWNRGDADA